MKDQRPCNLGDRDLKTLRMQRTKACNGVHRWIGAMMRPTPEKFQHTLGHLTLPTWWPFESEVLVRLVQEACRVSRRWAEVDPKAHTMIGGM